MGGRSKASFAVDIDQFVKDLQVELDEKTPPAPKAAIRKILTKAIGPSKAESLAPEKLTEISHRLAIAERHYKSDKLSWPNPSEQRDALDAVAREARKLLQTLGRPGKVSKKEKARIKSAVSGRYSAAVHPTGGPDKGIPLTLKSRFSLDIGLRASLHLEIPLAAAAGSMLELRRSVAAVQALYDWATAAAAQSAKSVKSRDPARHAGDLKTRHLLFALIEIWTDLGFSTGLSNSAITGEPTGSFIRFASACVARLDIQMTDKALSARLDRLLRSSSKK